MTKLVVVGAGAAGVFGAINAKINNPSWEVLLLEGGRRPLTKVKISGGGRCNVTHHCFEPRKLVENYPRGRRELLGPFHHFQPQNTIDWFKERGVELKVEADGRMFPITNSSQTIIDCLLGELDRLGIELRKGAQLKEVRKENDEFILHLVKGDDLRSDYLLVATGSAPIGHRVAASLGHTIVEPMPSLFTFNIEDPLLEGLAGQSFQLSHLKLQVPGRKKAYEQKGPLLFTHWGLSGPAVLKLSAFAARDLYLSEYSAHLRVNFLGLSQEEAMQNFQAKQNLEGNKSLMKSIPEGLTRRLWQRFLELQGLDGDTIWKEVSQKALRALVEKLCAYTFTVNGKGQFKDEFVTAGGVKLSEVDFRTMESKKCSGLYLAGEILDVDGITGGFNFQNAWTTSWLAAKSMSKK